VNCYTVDGNIIRTLTVVVFCVVFSFPVCSWGRFVQPSFFCLMFCRTFPLFFFFSFFFLFFLPQYLSYIVTTKFIRNDSPDSNIRYNKLTYETQVLSMLLEILTPEMGSRARTQVSG
jgi:hypothetical protein